MQAAAKLTHIGKYRITGEVGKGSMGVVYRAERDGKEFAIKVMRDKSLEASIRFRKEVSAIARLKHPCLVEVFDIGEDQGEIFMVMELLHGNSLESKIKSGDLSPTEIIEVSKDIAAALSEIHRFKMVHRDIKPANALLLNNNRAKLLDLGLIEVKDDRSKETKSRETVGTFHYSPPEQIGALKRPVDARSDLYALGITMFQMFTGELPFPSNDVSELYRSHASVVPPRIDVIKPSINSVVASIVEKLLKKDPDDRYQTAKSLIEDLSSLENLESALKTSGSLKLGAKFANFAEVSEVPLFGRERELEEIQNESKGLANGNGSVLLIEGESGLGKSRLAQEAIVVSKAKGALVLSAKCQIMSESIPLGPFREAIEGLIDRALEDQKAGNADLLLFLKKYFSTRSGNLRRIVPSVSELTEAPPSESVDLPALYNEVLDILLAVAQYTRNLLFLVDDIQWMDASSLEVMETLAEKIKSIPLQVIATSRNDQPSLEALAKFKRVLGGNINHVFDLKPLELKAVGDLVAYFLSGRTLDDLSIRKLYSVSKGSPFILGEYVRSLSNSGALRLVEGAWQIDEEALSLVNISSDVFKLISNRTKNLDPGLQRFLSLVALIGNTFDYRKMASIFQVSEATAISFVQTAVKENLLDTIDSYTYRFVHDRIRESLLKDLTPEKTKEYHDELATGYIAVDDNSNEVAFEAAKHLRLGNYTQRLDLAFQANLKAGSIAFSMSSFSLAFELLAFCQSMLDKHNPSDAIKMQLFQKLAKSAGETAQVDLAAGIIDENISKVDGMDRAKFLLIRASIFRSNKVELAWKAAKQCLSLVGITFPRSRIKIYMQINWMMLVTQYKIAFCPRITELPERPNERDEIAMECLYHSFILNTMKSDITAVLHIVYKMWLISHRCGNKKYLLLASTWISACWASFQMQPLSRMFKKVSFALANRLKEPMVLDYAKYGEIYTYVYMGDLVKAENLLITFVKDVRRHLEGFESIDTSLLFSCAYEQRGLSQNLIDYVTREASWLEKKAEFKGYIASHNMVLHSQLLLNGNTTEAVKIRENTIAQLESEKIKDDKWPLAISLGTILFSNLDQDEVGADTDSLISAFQGLGMFDAWQSTYWVVIGYLRLRQYEKAQDGDEKRSALRKLKTALRSIYFYAYSPVFRTHYYIILAAVKRCRGNYRSALMYLNQAEPAAKYSDSHWARYNIDLERARVQILRKKTSESEGYARNCHTLALKNGWKNRITRLKKEFPFLTDQVVSEGLTTAGSRTTHQSATVQSGDGSKNRNVIGTSRALQALLKVSLASAKSIDFVEQCRSVLDESIGFLNAERGFVFLPTEGKPKVVLGRDHTQGIQDILELKGFSSKVVQGVFEKNKAIVVAGTEEGEALGSESAVVHNLKSIISVPIPLGDGGRAVLYLDSRLAKGMFDNDDVEVLTAISNSIAVAYEMSRLAKAEIEKANLQSELANQAALAEAARKVEVLVDNMQQALFSVTSTGEIVEPVARYSDKIFHQSIAGKGVVDLLFKDISEEDRGKANSVMATVFGEDELQWDLIKDNLPVRVNYKQGEESQILSVKTNPIWNESQLLEKIMFVVEDITALEALSKKVEEQNRKVTIIGQMIEVDREDLLEIFEKVHEVLKKCDEISGLQDKESSNHLMRELHTLKGSFRLYGFAFLSALVHEVETRVLNSTGTETAAAVRKENLALIASQVLEYENAAKLLVGSSGKSKEMLTISARGLEHLNAVINELKGKTQADLVTNVESALRKLTDVPLKPALIKFSSMVNEIAARIGKQVALEVGGDEITMSKAKIAVIVEAFGHLIRNSVDHGIETADERTSVGKAAIGKIVVQCRESAGNNRITIADDGKGINPAIISQIAVKKGLLTADQVSALSEQEKINLIFAPNFSTKEEVSDISGRGVGMDVVRQRIEALGGRLVIQTKVGQGTEFIIDWAS